MKKDFEHDEKALLQFISQDDEKAFAVIVRQYWNSIYSQALAYVKSTQEAQDIVQDVFLKVWEKRKSLPNVERFDSFLFIIARNHIISSFRKKLAMPLQEISDNRFIENSNHPDSQLASKELNALIEKGIDLLPPQQKNAFLLSRQESLSYEAIAQAMGISKETVKKHIGRALNFLRTYISNYSDLTLPLALLYILF